MTYHCSRCNDDMHPRFRASHDRICKWVTEREARQVDRLLASLGMLVVALFAVTVSA